LRVLITGAGGQLARALALTAAVDVKLLAVTRTECDITQLETLEKLFRSFRPDVVINTAAYTAVDDAEENADLAFDVNARGAENVAKASELTGSSLIHISTDYVFDGLRSTAYPPDAPTNPINVYGASKLEGEKLALAASPSAVIIRVGWLYSPTGNNFLVKILTALRSSRALSVVRDQVGCPTSAREFAEAIWKVPGVRLRGAYHWANLGSGSWYDFAREIAQVAQQLGLLLDQPEIQPVATLENPLRAKRPRYSVLDSTKFAEALNVSASPWQHALRIDMTAAVDRLST
jgi:dTDP-4-dehydrorhamnose reductase